MLNDNGNEFQNYLLRIAKLIGTHTYHNTEVLDSRP